MSGTLLSGDLNGVLAIGPKTLIPTAALKDEGSANINLKLGT